MKNEPLVSIVVPVYNVKKHVGKCLDTLFGQSYKKIEIIVVDDGSTDGSGEICDEYALKDDRLRVYHKKNGGLSSARNYGIRRAEGEYICLVDSDDYVKSNYVSEMVAAADDDSVDIVVCGYNNMIPDARLLNGKEATMELLVKQQNIDIIAWNKMYRRSLFDEIAYPEGENYEDCLTTYKLLSRARNVRYIANSLYEYVERDGSITKNDKKEEKLEVREKAALEAMQYFKNDESLKMAAEIALLTAKLAFVDFSIGGVIKEECGRRAMKWIKKNAKKYRDNKFLTFKLKTYLKMICYGDGVSYKLFRKVRHE